MHALTYKERAAFERHIGDLEVNSQPCRGGSSNSMVAITDAHGRHWSITIADAYNSAMRRGVPPNKSEYDEREHT